MGAYDFDVIRIHGEENLAAYEVSDELAQSGWVGGLWVRIQSIRSWQEANSIRWKRFVDTAGPEDPLMFILRGSLEGTDQFTSRWPLKTRAVMCPVYGQFLFKYFEVNDKAERATPGTGSALTYALNENLYVSENGLLTSETETGVTTRGIGLCVGVPEDNNNYLGIEVLVGPW